MNLLQIELHIWTICLLLSFTSATLRDSRSSLPGTDRILSSHFNRPRRRSEVSHLLQSASNGPGSNTLSDPSSSESKRLGHSTGLSRSSSYDSGPHPGRRKTHIRYGQQIKNLTRPLGSEAEFYCDILGEPIPQFRWFKDKHTQITDKPNKFIIETGLWGSSLRIERIEMEDTGEYMCIASNPSGQLNATAFLTLPKLSYNQNSKVSRDKNTNNVFKNQSSSQIDGFCQEFHSNVCGQYLQGHQVFVTREFHQALTEAQISTLLKQTASASLQQNSEECLGQIMEAMCYYNFPVCLHVQVQDRWTSDDQVEGSGAHKESPQTRHHFQPIHLCRDDCLEVVQSRCSRTYNYLLKTAGKEVPALQMQCSQLPWYSNRHENSCRRIGVPLPSPKTLVPDHWTGLEHSSWEDEDVRVSQSNDNLEAELVTNSINGPDLLPIFVSFGVLAILSMILLIVCFVWHRNNEPGLRFRHEGSRFFGRSRSIGSGHMKLESSNGRQRHQHRASSLKPPSSSYFYSPQSERRLPGENDEFGDSTASPMLHNGSSKRRRVPEMGSALVLPKNSVMPIIDRGHSNSGDLPIANRQLPTTTVNRNDSAAAHYQFRTAPVSLPGQLPPPSSPAPPPPPQSTSSGTTITSGINGFTPGGNPSFSLPISVDPIQPFGVDLSDGMTAYTCLNNIDTGRDNCGPQQQYSSADFLHTEAKSVSMSDEQECNNPSIRAVDYPASQLRFGSQFGQGVFGPVYQAELFIHSSPDCNGTPNPNTAPTSITVVVKTLSTTSGDSLKTDFKREASLIAELNHPNLLGLFGVSLQQSPWCMLFATDRYLDLCELLRSTSNGIQTQYSLNGQSLTTSDKYSILTQVADGMDYLSSNRFVHRDLAARNVLINFPSHSADSRLCCRITDLGLARDCYAADYYRLHSHGLMLPIRWMPLNSIIYGRFSVKSDVWAYGVLAWEVWSNGQRPYGTYSDADVLDLVRGRHLLSCPPQCPPTLYSFMTLCWADDPQLRPSFGECSAKMHQWLLESEQGTGLPVMMWPPVNNGRVSATNSPLLVDKQQQQQQRFATTLNQQQDAFHYLPDPNPTTLMSMMTNQGQSASSQGQPFLPVLKV